MTTLEAHLRSLHKLRDSTGRVVDPTLRLKCLVSLLGPHLTLDRYAPRLGRVLGVEVHQTWTGSLVSRMRDVLPESHTLFSPAACFERELSRVTSAGREGPVDTTRLARMASLALAHGRHSDLARAELELISGRLDLARWVAAHSDRCARDEAQLLARRGTRRLGDRGTVFVADPSQAPDLEPSLAMCAALACSLSPESLDLAEELGVRIGSRAARAHAAAGRAVLGDRRTLCSIKRGPYRDLAMRLVALRLASLDQPREAQRAARAIDGARDRAFAHLAAAESAIRLGSFGSAGVLLDSATHPTTYCHVALLRAELQLRSQRGVLPDLWAIVEGLVREPRLIDPQRRDRGGPALDPALGLRLGQCLWVDVLVGQPIGPPPVAHKLLRLEALEAVARHTPTGQLIDPFDTLPVGVPQRSAARVADVLRAYHIMRRSEELSHEASLEQALAHSCQSPGSFAVGHLAEQPRAVAARVEDRVAFDLGVATGIRSNGLANAITRASLRAMGQSGLDPRTRDARLATLDALLDVASARSTLAITRAISSLAATPNRSALLTLLSRRNADAARPLAFDPFDPGASEVLGALERAQLLEPGYARTAAELAKAPVDSGSWQRLASQWQARFGRPLPLAALELIIEAMSEQGVMSPELVIESAVGRLKENQDHSLRKQLARMLDDTPLRRLAVSALTPNLPRVGVRHDDAWWKQAIVRACRALDVFRVDHRTLDRTLHGTSLARVRGALLRGRNPVTGAQVPVRRAGLSVRLLEKQREPLAFLRLCDAVSCCQTSTAAGPRLLPLMILADPLSFAFILESGSEARAQGFVFGQLGRLEGRTICLLNGVYSTHQTRGVRERVLDAIELQFARPLGLELIGVAAMFGGRGPLPRCYRREVRPAQRSLALCRTKTGVDPASLFRDDIESSREPGGYGLFWKDLGN